jgi:hypothetical protein
VKCATGVPDHSLLQRLEAIPMPVVVANGDSDAMVLPRYSHVLAGLIPDASLNNLPGRCPRLLVQDHAEFAPDVHRFLGA